MIDGHTNNILYQTIKQIVAKAKQEKKMESIRDLNIDWDEFKEFSPMQIIGLYNLIHGNQQEIINKNLDQ